MKRYNHKKIEKKWQKEWEKRGLYNRDICGDGKKPKYYVLDMFPYPSGDGLHMGHTESYTASDIIYRYKRLQGFDVLHPQGFDSFGLPAENYAVKTGIHPKETTKKNTENYIRQMKMLGLGHDLDHLIYTSDPSYYKWTQWLFGKFFENGLVERKTDKINWCPSCNTGIANEQVENGKCERCKTEIKQKEVPGWFFKITDFAEDLINDLDKVDWPEATKKNQRNWIGRSEGAKISFKIKKSSQTDTDLTQTNTEEYEILNDEKIIGTGVLLRSKNGSFLFQKRDNNTKANPNKIALFGGGINKGESFKECAVREIKEELNIDIKEKDLKEVGIFEGHVRRGTYMKIFSVKNIDKEKLTIQEGEKIVEMSLADALNNKKVTDFTKEVIKSFQNSQSNVILVHGCPSDKEKAMNPETRTYDKHWLPWIKKELEKRGMKVDFPLMPHPWAPVYEEHKKEFEKLDINENSILIGTSCGTSFLMRWLGETKQKVKALIMVAPWYDPILDKKRKTDFYNFEIDDDIRNRVDNIIIFTSDNDYATGIGSAKMLAKKFNAKTIEIKGYGHYLEKHMGTVEFPELLEEVVGKQKPNVVLMHGWGGAGKQGWFNNVINFLNKKGINVIAPDFPNTDNPIYAEWEKKFKQEVASQINENTIFIGHSLAPGFLMRYLSENDLKLNTAIFVAPVLHNKIEKLNSFFDKSFNWKKIKKAIEKIVIIGSDNDPYIPVEDFNELAEKLSTDFNLYKNRKHFSQEEKNNPEVVKLLEKVLFEIETSPRESVSGLRNSATSEETSEEVEVFTTRPDTLFGATYLVLAPEHPLIEKLKLEIKNWSEVKNYMERAKNKTEMERLESKDLPAPRPGIYFVYAILCDNGAIYIGQTQDLDKRWKQHVSGQGAMYTKIHKPIKVIHYEMFNSRNEAVDREKWLKTGFGRKWLKREFKAGRTRQAGKTGVKLEGLVAVNPAIAKMLSQSQTDADYMQTDAGQTQKDAKKNILRGSVLSPRESVASSEAEIPIFVADYVLGGYGTGAIMAVPAHDERDYAFASQMNAERTRKYAEGTRTDAGKIEIRQVIDCGDLPCSEKGKLINSGKFNGMDSEEAKKAITEFVGGEMTTNYRLRDWSISRQRYWGCPIPIVYSPEGEAKFVGEENLPWLLPEDVDFQPTGTAPLAKSKELKKRTEKLFGKGWTPEVDTMDTFVDSSWYFLRYPDPENEKEFCSPEKLKRWLPVDLYIGGAEHTYMHLLYARFFVKAMHKMGLLEFDEPFLKLRHQGMVLDENGVKMSKSKGNVVNPNDMVEKFGADATRMYMMFAAPLDEEIAFKEEGVKGVYRFLEKVFSLFERARKNADLTQNNAEKSQNGVKFIDCGGGCEEVPKELPVLLHKTIKGVTEDIEEMKFNTAISKLMIFINTASRITSQSQTDAERTQKNAEKNILRGSALSPRSSATLLKVMEKFLILLSPFAPFITEELWLESGHKDSIFNQEWPKYNPEMIKEEEIELVVQVNGKLRDKIKVPANISEEEAKEKALASEKIKKYTDGKEIKKVIFVKGKLVNLVI